MSRPTSKTHSFPFFRNVTHFFQLPEQTPKPQRSHATHAHLSLSFSDLIHLSPLRIEVVVHVVRGEGLRAHPKHCIRVGLSRYNAFHVVILGCQVFCLQQVDANYTLRQQKPVWEVCERCAFISTLEEVTRGHYCILAFVLHKHAWWHNGVLKVYLMDI